MVNQTQGAVPADILLDLSATLCPRGKVVEPKSVDVIVGRCDDPGRRSELVELIDRLDALPPAERHGIVESLDDVQVRSKLWLIDELVRLREPADLELLILGAWYGTLPLLFNLCLERPPATMICVDIDPRPCRVGREVIGSMYPNIQYRCGDVMDHDYGAWADNPATVVVNTICEHLPDVAGWWRRLPPGQLVVLQSNNYFACPDHVNAVRCLGEMKEQTPLSEVLFEGVLALAPFDRFMIIGRR